jgi:hypothetical protein
VKFYSLADNGSIASLPNMKSDRQFAPARSAGSSWLRQKGLVACAVAALAALALVGASAAAPYNPDNLPNGQVAGIGEICHSVMGIMPNTEQYQSCLESLTDSASRLDQGYAMSRARVACLSQGLRPGETNFSECELRVSEAAARPAGDWPGADSRSAAPTRIKSYSYASPAEVFRRERYSCARLGYDPADAAFSSCVAALQASMFEADNPAH